MASEQTPDGERGGSTRGFDRDVERLDSPPVIDDVTVDEPSSEPGRSGTGQVSPASQQQQQGGGPDAIVRDWSDLVLARAARLSGGSSDQVRAAFDPTRTGIEVPKALPEMALVRDALVDKLQHESAETRHLAVDAPTETRPGQDFPVHAQLTLAPRGPVSPETRPFLIPQEEGRLVTIDLTASENLAPHGDTTAQVLVRRGQDSDPVRFELEGTREGKATVDIRAFAGQQFVGGVHLELTIHANARAGQQRATSPGTLTALDPEALTLEIRLDSQRKFYEFQLRGPGFVEPPVRADVDALDTTARGLQQQLDALAKGTPNYSARALQAVLRGQGSAIWSLLPPAVQTTLGRSIGQAERLCILTSGDPMPWELVFASGPGAGMPGFLSDLFLVTRWQYGPSPPLDIGRGHRCYVSPPAKRPGAPTAAAAEIAKVQARIGSGPSLNTVDQVLGEIDTRQFGLMHFAAHNVPDVTRPLASAIQLDQPFIQAMIGDDRKGTLRDRQPLVFVNACSSATPTRVWSSAEDWATRFLVAGAGGFIGTLWAIRDSSALLFADTFYREIADGKPLGPAFRDARLAIKAEGDPTWLAYTLYANPYAHFHGVGL